MYKELSNQISIVSRLRSSTQYSMPQVYKSNVNFPNWSQAMILQVSFLCIWRAHSLIVYICNFGGYLEKPLELNSKIDSSLKLSLAFLGRIHCPAIPLFPLHWYSPIVAFITMCWGYVAICLLLPLYYELWEDRDQVSFINIISSEQSTMFGIK